MENARHSGGNRKGDKILVEIRWFYERRDIVGFSASAASNDAGEIFETDHVDVIDAKDCLLSPANLRHESAIAQSFMGSPIQSFVCRRFWSTTRKSLIPCGNLEGRMRRGMLYSKQLPEALKQLSSEANAEVSRASHYGSPTLTWRESMLGIIGKLTLKDASRGAYERGEALIGREKELQTLLSFFRASIRGEAGTGGIKSSIFIAGPPGVGKTACVRAAIARLRNDESHGEIPKFNFISLNGMEMRHPYEAYVKLWEGINGRKHVGTCEKACEKLEFNFTNPNAIRGDDDRTVSVVLVDEIDYLVTEKQSVLYNFFDWPKRAAEVPDGRRLVVIGISNTLNLAEQLMPSVQSRVGSERICFNAYKVPHTVAILKAKIKEASPNFSIFEDDAILFAAKKTAALSGDIRKAFHVCRAATELVLRKYGSDRDIDMFSKGSYPKVRIADVQQASRESFNMAMITAVSYSTSYQALLLISLVSLCRSTGREVGGFDLKDILVKMEALAGVSGDPQYSPPPSFGETVELLNRLGEKNLIELKTCISTSTKCRSSSGGSGGAWPMATLAVDEHTIMRGLKNTVHKALAEKNMPWLL